MGLHVHAATKGLSTVGRAGARAHASGGCRRCGAGEEQRAAGVQSRGHRRGGSVPDDLEDSKDATFIFLATALGLACGVQLEVAAVLSVLFNAAVLILWSSDFARMPPSLEGVRAKRQLERAMQIANRTSQFVARLDNEVLEALAPAQLDALEDRLRKRRADMAGGAWSARDTTR